MADDYTANIHTTGSVAVGGSATGVIEKRNDVDWFAVELVAGQTYVIDLEGGDAEGALGDAMLRGLYDAGGNRIAGTRNHDGGEGADARLTFTAAESGTHYIAARSQGRETGAYTVRVTAFDADATAAGATDLGDLAALGRTRTQQDTVDGGADGTDYYRFTLSEARQVRLTLRRQDADADLYLEDADGAVLHSSTRGGTRNDGIDEMLEAGTYYVRVVAQEEGENAYKLRYRAAEPEPVAQPEPDPDPQPEPQPQQEPEPQPLQGAPQQQQVVVPTNVPEPEGQDFSADTSTEGRVLVGGSVTGDYGGYGWSARDDWFAVELVAGQAYVIDLKGAPNGNGKLSDPMIRGVYDADGNVIPDTYNDDGGEGYNARTFFAPGADGTYYVAASGFGIEATSYTLSVAKFPDDFLAAPGTEGEVAVGGSATGVVGHAGDRDWFAVTLEKGKAYRFDLEGTDPDSGGVRNPYLGGIYDSDGNFFAGTANDDGGEGNNSRTTFTAWANGTYYVSAGGHGGHTGSYKLSVFDVSGSVSESWGEDFPQFTTTKGRVEVGGTASGKVDYDINGWIWFSDIDWFAVDLEGGMRYRIDVKQPSTGGARLEDPYLYGIYNSNGGSISHTADDDSGEGRNARKYFTPETNGTYYVAATSSHSTYFGYYEVSVALEEIGDTM